LNPPELKLCPWGSSIPAASFCSGIAGIDIPVPSGSWVSGTRVVFPMPPVWNPGPPTPKVPFAAVVVSSSCGGETGLGGGILIMVESSRGLGAKGLGSTRLLVS